MTVLVKNGRADVTLKNTDDDDSIQLCMSSRIESFAILQVLLEETEADPFAVNKTLMTAFRRACSKGFRNSVNLMLSHPTCSEEKINAVDLNGNTALHDAISNNFEEIAKRLVEEGADPDQQNFNGQSPKDLAATKSSSLLAVVNKASAKRREDLIERRKKEDEEAKAREARDKYESSDLVQFIRQSEATKGPDYDFFAQALYEEFESLEELKTFFRRMKDPKSYSVKFIQNLKTSGKLRPRFEVTIQEFLDSLVDELLSPVSTTPRQSAASKDSSFNNVSLSGGGQLERSSSVDFPSDITQFSWEDFEIVSENPVLGEGSFGCVYHALYFKNSRRDKTGRQVAIKVMSNMDIPSPKLFEQIRAKTIEEAKLVKQISDKVERGCVVGLYGVVQGPMPPAIAGLRRFLLREGETALGIVMEFVGGGSLKHLLHEKHVRFSLQEKIRILLKLAFAISELHDARPQYFIHGDIKPDNVLLSEHSPPEVRLADFGLTGMKEALDMTRQSTSMRVSMSVLGSTTTQKGTPLYSAPEILPNLETGLSQAPSRRSDLYAFGILAWELLAEEEPFRDATNMYQHNLQVQKGRRPDITKLPLDVPQAVKQMIVNLWDADRSKRPEAAECCDVLSHIFARMCSDKYDIFFSHPWADKVVLRHVYRALCDNGYRVWFDEHDMGYHLKEAMDNGVMMSSSFIACIDLKYQNSDFCMRELRAASADASKKPIIVLVTQSLDEQWANNELKSLCSTADKKYVDISELCTLQDKGGSPLKNSDGTPCTWENPSDELLEMLRKKLDELFKILAELKIPKSMNSEGFLRRSSSTSTLSR